MSLMSFLGRNERGVDRIRRAIEEYKPSPVYVMFSGGKDSALATYYTLKATDNVLLVYIHIPGQTHLDNVRAVYGFIRELEEKLNVEFEIKRAICRNKNDLRTMVYRVMDKTPVLVHAVCNSFTLNKPYWETVKQYGFPALTERMNGGYGKRWCCAEFKTLWLNTLPPNTGKRQRVLVSGVKKTDSLYRNKRYSNYIEVFRGTHVKYTDITVFPLIDYTDIEVIMELEKNGFQSILNQYKKWGRSPNCVLCPFMSNEQFRRAITRLPRQYIANIKQRLEKLREKYKENTFAYKKITRWLKTIEEVYVND